MILDKLFKLKKLFKKCRYSSICLKKSIRFFSLKIFGKVMILDKLLKFKRLFKKNYLIQNTFFHSILDEMNKMSLNINIY